MPGNALTLLAVGDLILGMPVEEAASYFSMVNPVLKSADIVVGQGELLFTDRGVTTYPELLYRPLKPCDPRNIKALYDAGFQVITLAGNHVWDSGIPGIEDTLSGLEKYGLAGVGLGMNIDEARQPAIIERAGTKIGFLDYNCVGPFASWANEEKPGCAYVNIITHYELNISNPGGYPTIRTFADPPSLAAMEEDIQKLRPRCDVLVVGLHKGLLYLRNQLAMYDRQVPYAAIDAGADLILGGHAHILKGVEYYKGKPIFHGLGNFITRAQQVTKSQIKFDDKMQLFTGHYPPGVAEEINRTIIVKCVIEDGRIQQVRYLPCLINKKRQPEILIRDERGQVIFDYMDAITKEAGLNAGFRWDVNEVVIQEK